jgi:SulP family sulfate permease
MSSHADTPPTSDDEPEVNQPGLGELREAVANYAKGRLPGPPSLRRDGLAGLNAAISSVPDGLASGVLVGVNPMYGLYACMAGPIAGGLFSSTQLMIVATTSSASLSAGQALAALPYEARDNPLFVMVLLIGAFQVALGMLGLGRLTRFVSYSVMTGFVIGIASLTVISQLSTITRYQPSGGNRITQTLDVLINIGQADRWTLAVSAFTLVLAILLPRTRLGNIGRLAAVVIPSACVALFGLDSVQLVRDVGTIPEGVPTPNLPSFFDVTFDVVTGAVAVAAIVLVQGAGVSQGLPNPDGSRRSQSRDFVAQGAANIASGFFRGLPVGGSLSTSALSVVSGARTRWAAIFSGVWMAVLVIAVPGLVSVVAMPTLGILLIVASVNTIKPGEAHSIWDAGWPSRLAAITTFLSTLLLPIQAAVGIGTVLSALLHIYTSSSNVSVVEQVERPDGKIEERRPSKELASDRVTVLDVYGHLFYAGARTFERLLPKPQDAERPVVILRLRGRTNLGATLIDVLANYASKLEAANGRLYLTGISEAAYDHVIQSGKLNLSGPIRAYPATPVLGEATRQALGDAQAWLVGQAAEKRDGLATLESASPNDGATTGGVSASETR